MRFLSPDLRSATLHGLVMAVFLLCAGCSRHSEESQQVVLAKVGDTVITEKDFNLKLKERQQRTRAVVHPAELLQEMVDREVLYQNAKTARLEDDPEVRELVKDVLISKLKERRLSAALDAVEVSDAEVSSAYEAEKSHYLKPEMVHLAMLFLATGSPQSRADAKARLQSAAEQAVAVKPSEGFGALSVAFSEDQESRYRGGDIGWIARGQLPARIDSAAGDVAFALSAVGQISSVIEAAGGCYLFRLVERRASSAEPLEQVAERVKQKLLQEKRAAVTAKFQSDLGKSVSVEMYPDRLKAAQQEGKESTPPPVIP